MEDVKLKSIELINDLKNDNLTKSNLRDYYRMVLNNFEQVINFSDYSDYRFSGAIFGVMLEINDFENDPDIRQSMASIGFYILSKGMEKFCLDQNNYFITDKSIEQIELISSRLSVLLASSASMKFSLRLSKPNTNPYYSPMMDRYEAESSDYSDIILCDSYTVKYLCSNPVNEMFLNESAKFANKTYERFAGYGNISERVENGRECQIRLYEFLKNQFEIEKDYTFD